MLYGRGFDVTYGQLIRQQIIKTDDHLIKDEIFRLRAPQRKASMIALSPLIKGGNVKIILPS